MKKPTFVQLMNCVQELDKKADQLCAFLDQTVESVFDKIMDHIIDIIEADVGLSKFDADVACVVGDYCFRFNYGTEYNGTALVIIDGKEYFPRDFDELYDVVIEMVGNANQ